MWIIKNKKIFLTISALLVGASLLAVIIFGLKLGIDFKGGAQTEMKYTVRPVSSEATTLLRAQGLTDAVVQEVGGDTLSIKTRALSETERQDMVMTLQKIGQGGELENFNSIGPSVGRELVRKSLLAIVLVSLAIVLFIAYAFRHVSRPVSSWRYGLIAITTLIHDIAIPSGVFAILGKINGAEVDTLFVVALLTVLGLSVSDTIVVFDRIRENLRLKKGASFEETVGMSLSETFGRSINTSLTVIIALSVLYFLGPDTTKNFSLVLIVGMLVGTYSSIFVASPLLTIVEKFQRRKRN
jgi:preprotein translocase subunit SecF